MLPRFLHFIWLGGSPNFSAWKGIRRWAEACYGGGTPPTDRIYPILWIDSAAKAAMVDEHLQYSVSPTYNKTYKPKYIFKRLHANIFEPLHTNIAAQLGPIKTCGYMIGTFKQPIPIANIDENLGLFEQIVVREPNPQYRLGAETFRDLIFAMQKEANIQIGGAPVLASDMLRILLLRCFGGMYVDAVGIEPKLVPLSRSRVEDVLQRAGQLGHPPAFIRTGIVIPYVENFAAIADINDSDIKLLLTRVLQHYAEYYQHNPSRGIHERLRDYAIAIGNPALTMHDYLADLKRFGMNFRRVLARDVAELNSQKYEVGSSSWFPRAPFAAAAFEDDEDSDTDLFGNPIPGKAVPKPKPRPAISPDTEALMADYRKAQLGSALGRTIGDAGYKFFVDLAQNYSNAKDIISLGSLSEMIFGQTPLKGHMVCSYEHPFLGRARNYWEAANTMGDIFPRPPKAR